MTTTRTYTKTRTFTAEEKVILESLNQARIPIDFIALCSRAKDLGTKEVLAIDQELCLTVTGQLIERGVVERLQVREDGDTFYRRSDGMSIPDRLVGIGEIIQVAENWTHDRHPEDEYVSPRGQWLDVNDYRDLYDLLCGSMIGPPAMNDTSTEFQIPDFSRNMVVSDKVGGIQTLMRIK
jgi:hypothetical protein